MLIEMSFQLTRESLIQRFFGGNLVAEKLDSLLVLTFEHLESCTESGRLIQVTPPSRFLNLVL